MPWQSGHYYVFSHLLINAVVPAESGVFAVYASHEQAFIAEAANMREALLRLYGYMRRFGFTRPAGFTFELCSEASRMNRLKELLYEHETMCDEQPSNVVLYG